MRLVADCFDLIPNHVQPHQHPVGKRVLSTWLFVLWLPSFVYPIHCLQPFPPPYRQPYRDLVISVQQFDLIDVGLVETNGGEGNQKTRPDVDLFSCFQNIFCSVRLSLL